MRQLCTWPRLQAHGRAATADLGASVITGIDGNPLAVLAKQLQIPLHDINTANVPLYLAGGEEAAAELDAEVRLQNAQPFWMPTCFCDVISCCGGQKPLSEDGGQLPSYMPGPAACLLHHHAEDIWC